MTDLVVELYGCQIGMLHGSDFRSFDFRITDETFEHFELGSRILSESIPLETRGRRDHAERRRNFFRELLPEGLILENLARSAGVSAFDTIGLLRHAGRDVAGALQIYAIDEPTTEKPYAQPLTSSDVRNMLRRTQQAPLGNDPTSGKSSLAGVQDKIVLASLDGAWHRCHNGFPSTHIVKPVNVRYPDMIYNEAFALELARAVGITSFDSNIADFDGSDALVIQRYDRARIGQQIDRIHQEDVLQALGVARESKYQAHGGQMTLARAAGLFSAYGDKHSLEQLLRMVTFSVAIGNLDLHGKNISLLHERETAMRIAPAYDLVPLAHYENVDGDMAMSVNGTYRHADIARDDLIVEATTWGLSRDGAGVVVDETLDVLSSSLENSIPDEKVTPELVELIADWTGNLRQ